MNTSTQETVDLKRISAAALDFYKASSNTWMDIMEKSYFRSGNGRGDGGSWPGMDSLKLWPSWQNVILKGATDKKPEVSNLLAVCSDQYKNYYNLGKAWFDCTRKTMEAMRLCIQKRNTPDETIEICRESAVECYQSYLSFVDSQFSQLLQARELWTQRNEESGKPDLEKVRAQSVAKS